MAKPNYSFEKRQREIAKKKKKDEKRQRKLDNASGSDAEAAANGEESSDTGSDSR